MTKLYVNVYKLVVATVQIVTTYQLFLAWSDQQNILQLN